VSGVASLLVTGQFAMCGLQGRVRLVKGDPEWVIRVDDPSGRTEPFLKHLFRPEKV
jgi:hypothetical protein